MGLPDRYMTKRVKCPECGNVQRIRWRSGIKRFKPKLFGCNECDFTGQRGLWDEPDKYKL